MPEISRFLGIMIGMFFNEHGVPHFHAVYGEYEMTVDLRVERCTATFRRGRADSS
jgi:hypothetical protein